MEIWIKQTRSHPTASDLDRRIWAQLFDTLGAALLDAMGMMVAVCRTCSQIQG